VERLVGRLRDDRVRDLEAGVGFDPGADARAQLLSILGLGRGEDLDRVELLRVHQVRSREESWRNCAHRASPASVHFPIRP